jgi:mannose-1-phosphate guanylyltransferase/phosphomannomutase
MNKAVIMAGGFGTRLRPLSIKIPKPMVSVMNSPMMEHIVNLLKKNDIKNIVSVLYFQPDVIRNYFEDGSKFDIVMKYVMANADYGTAGAVRNAYELLDERFIIISGDVLTDFDLSKAIEFHKNKKSDATILLTRVPKPLQYGIVMTDKEGKITRFLEKPSWGQVFSDTINTGIYILEPHVLDLIPYQQEFDFSKDLFPLMLEKKMGLYGYIAEGYWRDVGNLDEYQKGQYDGIRGKISLEVKGRKKGNYVLQGESKISSSVKFTGNTIIGDNCNISEHAEIVDCIIGKNVRIGMGVKLERVTLWDNVTIGDFSEITDSVICNDCELGDNVTIMENVFVAEGCKIGSKATLTSNIKLWPNKEIEEGATLSTSLVQEEKWLRELFTDARISGMSNVEIHPEFGAKLGAAYGMSYGKNVTIIASRDTDKVSRIMKRAISAGLSSVGVNIHDVQITSIPQTRQELRANKYAGGFHVRRSPRYEGVTDIILFSKEGRDINISMTKSIERYFFGEDIKRVNYDKLGEIFYPERTNEIYRNRYLECLKVDLIKEAKFKLLIDYSYGLASRIFPYILGKLNAEALSLHDFVDTTRFQSMISAENTAEAEKIMRSLGYGLGFIIEPGAEKISVLDERGVLYNPTRLLTIITKLFLETNKQREPYKITVSVLASKEIELIAQDYNVEVIRIKDTHSAMMESTREDKVLFVGGVWGNFIFPDFLFAADGMYSIGKILEMLSETGLKISKLDEELPVRYQYQKSVSCPWEHKGKVMRMAMNYSDSMDRELVDGVKIFFGNSSVLVLPDREKASFLVLSESNEPENAVELTKRYCSLVQQWRDDEND